MATPGGGLKHVATEPAQFDNKRERGRRGAAGRAAALRRAPSDSDCSGETASLSADSADRVRTVLPTPRQTKSRRRRGSEWEVLEGLKDGQRFERRPEVFNGYLHKKRKWPLKGWHKRFFVVDGGILVYARSPTDVARGRLHGSVDVGLSVISAKARRRRIDIDADEFIYHLRAKTPDVFRTWLNVLKTHRLYRQHLLTFGAREPVPKIHAPVEDLPPTDTSSHSSLMTELSDSDGSSNSDMRTIFTKSSLTSSAESIKMSFESNICNINPVQDWNKTHLDNEELIPLNFEPLTDEIVVKTERNLTHSLCSMHCMKAIHKDEVKKLQDAVDLSKITEKERQLLSTNLDKISPKTHLATEAHVYTALLKNSSNLSLASTLPAFDDLTSIADETRGNNEVNKESLFRLSEDTAYFLFKHKKARVPSGTAVMRKSNKSTNLFKYKNLIREPSLEKPIPNSIILRTNLVSTRTGDDTGKKSGGFRNISIKQPKSVVDVACSTHCDLIAEKLIKTFLNLDKCSFENVKNIQMYVAHIMQDASAFKSDTKDINHVKLLFKKLLEYWLESNSMENCKEVQNMRNCFLESDKVFKTVDTQIDSCTKDAILSNTDLSTPIFKTTQTSLGRSLMKKSDLKQLSLTPSQRFTFSFIKEKRVQELERLLRNTVYTIETVRSQSNLNFKYKDMEITKKLIDNLEPFSSATDSRKDNTPSAQFSKNNSQTCLLNGSSSEYSKIQKTLNNLIGETSMASTVAKDILRAYLQVLTDDNKLLDSSSGIEESKGNSNFRTPSLDRPVQTDSFQRKVSIGTITAEIDKNNETIVVDKNRDETKVTKNHFEAKVTDVSDETTPDPGQIYLKEVLDKISTYFKTFKPNAKKSQHLQSETKVGGSPRAVIEESPCSYDTSNTDDSLVLHLTKYDLLQVAVLSDSSINGEMSITIKLKERTPNSRAMNPNNVILKLNEAGKPVYENTKQTRIANASAKSYFRRINSRISFKNPYSLNFDMVYELKPFLSNSDATSKAYKVMYDNNDLMLPPEHESKKSFDIHEDHQSCYMLSNLKRSALPSMFSSKRRNKKECLERQECPTTANTKRQDAPATTTATRIIDEKFILMMLENLTLLSRNIPTLHKDILSLYMKLKKKHDKVMREPPGLGLLGKIYNVTQPSEDMYSEPNDGNLEGVTTKPIKPRELVSVSAQVVTSPDIWRLVNESTSVYAVTDNEAQTVLMFDMNSIGYLKATKHTSVTDFNRPRLSYHEDANIKGSRSQKLEIESKERNIGNYLSSLMYFLITTKSFSTITDEKQTKMETELQKVDLEKGIIHSRIRTDKKDPTTPIISKLYPCSTRIRISNQIVERKPMISHTLPSCLLEQTQKTAKMFDRRNVQKGFNIYYARGGDQPVQIKIPNREVKVIYKSLDRSSSVPSLSAGLVSPASPPFRVQAGFVAGTPGGRLANWIVESGGPLENASRELGQAQLSVQQLQRLLDALELQHHHHDTDVSLGEGASPNVKKDRRKFGLRKKKSNSKCASVELQPPIAPSPSHMALSALTAPPSPGGGASSVPNSAASLPIACAAARPQSLPGAEALGGGPASLASLTPDQQLREDFTVLAKDLVATLNTVLATLVCERGRLRAAMEAAEGGGGGGGGGAVVAALRTNLSSALQQNSELRTRLSRIHDASDLAEISSVNNTDPAARPFQQSLSFSSSCVSASEFFDAEEHEPPQDLLPHDEAGVIELDGDSSSEAGSLSSEEGSASSDNSDGALLSAEPAPLLPNSDPPGWSRRTTLPCPRPTPGGPSLWNLLYKNIGKDLSQVSMPVTINEPLNMLQRLCEELEYSELLDAAAECRNPLERMALIAAFAVSAYAASAHRAASKPFNPLLHETYECVRGDRGFKFLAEQVSHHPPISACHAESSRWVFWQEARIKTKFWGKSMEFQPAGRVHVRLVTTGDHYSWNKVTTCVHNLFGGQRWVDQYGDMHITCHGTDISAKLNFIKASSWSSSRHEVRGWAAGGGARLRLAGRWSEALHAGEPPAARCLWRPGAMPPEHELYYGFTRFAMELNEMEPGLRELLPRTDTRLRPDQRALEEGDVEAAEGYKLQLERAQRDRRNEGPPPHPAWFRKALEEGEEMWVFTGEYWRAREAGFPPPPAPLW